ncbi:MAG: cupin domain-containing protein [Bryobacterales bacterium]|nr:cupin domain-containing protein [Bryobacterales bacterium]
MNSTTPTPLENEKGPAETAGSSAVERTIGLFRLGEKLRRLRLRKKISLVDLGKHTGLSPSMLSQLENGKLIPTLPTLTRIAMVFDVGLDFFFSEQEKGRLFSVVRAKERLRFPDEPDTAEPSSFFECLAFSAREKSIQAYVAEFPVRHRHSEPHVHEGSEFLYVLTGRVEIWTSHDLHVLNQGDSCYFDSSEPHSYRCAGETQASALVVTAAPRL